MLITSNLETAFREARSGMGLTPKEARNLARAPRTVGAPIRFGADIQNLLPPIRDPRLNPDQFYLPRVDSKGGEPNATMYAWIEHYYKFHPLIGNAVEIHAQLPLSRFGLSGVDDPAIMDVYETMADDLNLIENLYNFLKCWWLFGEVMPYFWWSETHNRFVSMTFIDSSRVRVIGHYLAFSPEGEPVIRYELEPDQHLRSLVRSSDPYDRMVAQLIDPQIRYAVDRGLNIELDPFSTELVCNKAVPWDLRGTSIVTGIIKDLLYSDTLRLAQNSVAQGMITPKWVWKLGSPGPDGYMPTDGDLAAFRELLLDANNDPMFNIITHYAVSVDVIGASGKILPITNELDWVDKRIMTRMFTNKALTTGEGPNFATASVALRALMSRYLVIRTMVEDFFLRKVFLPVALANDFIDEDGNPILPKFNWRHKQSLLDDASIKASLLQLRAAGDMPLKVVCDALDLDYDEVLLWLDKEQGTLADRQFVEARKQYVVKAFQTAREGIEGVLKAVLQTLLPKTQEEAAEKDEGDVVPEGYDPNAPVIEAPESTSPAKSPSGPKPPSGPQPPTVPKPQAAQPMKPLGGEAGETVVEKVPGESSLHESYRRQTEMRAARRIPDLPIRAMTRRLVRSAITSDDGVPLSQWQERLLLSRVDKESQNDIIAGENHVLNVFERERSRFVESLLDFWRGHGTISMEALQHAARDSVDRVNEQSRDDMAARLTALYERSADAAVEKIQRSKTGRRYLAARRAQMPDDRQQNLNDALDGAFQRINTVSAEVIETMRSKLREQQDGIPADIVKALFEELDTAEAEGVSEEELAARLGDLWDKQRYIYQRIVRTETINMYNRASLQEWYAAGVRKVVRREMHDDRVCGYCRTVDGHEYDIEKIMALDYPLIQNPDTGEYEGHPHCRGSFEPADLSFEDFDEFMIPPGAAVVDRTTVEQGLTRVTDIPEPLAPDVQRALEDNDLKTDVTIVGDVVDTPEWHETQKQRLIEEALAAGQPVPSDLRLDMEVNELAERERGNQSAFQASDGSLLVSGFSFFADDPAWFVYRTKAAEVFASLLPDQLQTVTDLYNFKRGQTEYTLEEDGIQIIGSPGAGEGAGFITPDASQDVQSYFTESYTLYQTDSYKLEFMDPQMYAFLRDEIFDGKEFQGGGVVS